MGDHSLKSRYSFGDTRRGRLERGPRGAPDRQRHRRWRSLPPPRRAPAPGRYVGDWHGCRDQLARAERLRQVVVSADLQAENLVDLQGPGASAQPEYATPGEGVNRPPSRPVPEASRPAPLDPGRPGRRIQRRRTVVRRGEYGEAFLLQAEGQGLPKQGLVIHEKNCRVHRRPRWGWGLDRSGPSRLSRLLHPSLYPFLARGKRFHATHFGRGAGAAGMTALPATVGSGSPGETA